MLDTLEELRLDDHLRRADDYVRFSPATRAADILRRAGASQSVFPVEAEDGRLVGLITPLDVTRLESSATPGPGETAAEIMRPAIAVRFDDDLRSAFELMRAESLSEVPVCDADGRVVGFIDEVSVARAFLRASSPEAGPTS